MKIDRLLLALASLAAALVALAGSSQSARAQVYVIESSVPDIKVGAQFAMADSLSIPAGGAIRAVLPSGKTQTVKGPYHGPIADLAKGQEVNDGVVGWLKNIMLTGGATEATPGATRSASAPARPGSAITLRAFVIQFMPTVEHSFAPRAVGAAVLAAVASMKVRRSSLVI